MLALIENVAVGAKEMRALGLDVYVLFATSVVLVSGYGAAKIYTCSFAKCWRHRERILLQQSLVFCKKCLCWHTYLFRALSAVAPVLVHAYLIVFKCIISTDSNLEELAHSCCASVWAFFYFFYLRL